jgi:hypothetical protein
MVAGLSYYGNICITLHLISTDTSKRSRASTTRSSTLEWIESRVGALTARNEERVEVASTILLNVDKAATIHSAVLPEHGPTITVVEGALLTGLFVVKVLFAGQGVLVGAAIRAVSVVKREGDLADGRAADAETARGVGGSVDDADLSAALSLAQVLGWVKAFGEELVGRRLDGLRFFLVFDSGIAMWENPYHCRGGAQNHSGSEKNRSERIGHVSE